MRRDFPPPVEVINDELNNPPSCVICRHAVRESFLLWAEAAEFIKCGAAPWSERGTYNPVSGVTVRRTGYWYASIERTSMGNCGPTGKRWEPRPPNRFIEWIKRQF